MSASKKAREQVKGIIVTGIQPEDVPTIKVIVKTEQSKEVYSLKFDGNYHCSKCGKTFRGFDTSAFLRHQKDCKGKTGRLI